MWPMLWAMWIAAGGVPDLYVLFVFVAGTALMRSAGCAINDYADRDIDGHVWRTNTRPIAAGHVSAKEALGVFAALSLIAFALVLTLDSFTVQLSFGGVFLAALYPFTKRFTHLPQLFLGAAFAWAIPMAFAAVGADLGRECWLLYIAAVLWALAYDTLYAMADRDDDVKIGVKSTAILFGHADIAIVAVVQALVLITLLLVGDLAGMGVWYFTSVIAAVLFVIYQLWLVREREPKACVRAFLNNHYLGMTVFAGVVLDYATR
jgi:4-hydroxybenzoate polyprenyltransferase